MRPSYFVLYSAVATQAATALLLSCALYVLGRYYPRYFLRLWAGAWLAESFHVALGMVALIAFLWGVKNGVFENAEDAKYIVFRDEDDD